jgi:hypothetical protein
VTRSCLSKSPRAHHIVWKCPLKSSTNRFQGESIGIGRRSYLGSHQLGVYGLRKLGHRVAKNVLIDTTSVALSPPPSTGSFSFPYEYLPSRLRTVNACWLGRNSWGSPRTDARPVDSQTRNEMMAPMPSSHFVRSELCSEPVAGALSEVGRRSEALFQIQHGGVRQSSFPCSSTFGFARGSMGVFCPDSATALLLWCRSNDGRYQLLYMHMSLPV